MATNADAGNVAIESELSLLPSYCLGTQAFREVSKDRTPIEEHMRTYGRTYHHLHHYCAALVIEIRNGNIRDANLIKSKLNYALREIQYVLDRADPQFILLPDIYVTRARILSSLNRDAEAVTALQLAIGANNKHVQSYLQLSAMFKKLGIDDRAITTLQDGLKHSPGNKSLMRQIRRLGATPDPNFSEVKTEALAPDTENALGKANGAIRNGGAQSEKTNDDPSMATGNPEAKPTGSKVEESSHLVTPKSTPSPYPSRPPYCRFCP